MSELSVRNRQCRRSLDVPLLRKIASHLFDQALATERYEVGIYVISALEMAEINETYLQHHGSTDVITFQYDEAPQSQFIHGEIFISIDDAFDHAKRFQTSWQSEVIRYLVHGALHLHGYDDTSPKVRKVMKQQENKLLEQLRRIFDFSKLDRKRMKG